LDAALYPQDSADWAEYLDPYLKNLRQGYTGVGKFWQTDKGTFPDCQTPGTGQNIEIFGSWLYNPFIYAPTLSSLIAGAPEDGDMVDAAGTLLADGPLPDGYYLRCWTLLGNLMLSGAMESAGKVL
jgi:hypothetical protein